MGREETVFADLRRLADWFSTRPQRSSVQVDRIATRLGVTAVPLLGRELSGSDARRRDGARAALAAIATSPSTTEPDSRARARVIEVLRAITESDSCDEAKVSALGLLAELGERAAATFTDPSAIQRRSAVALASQLGSDADVASAADLMVRQLADSDIIQMIEVMVEAAPAEAYRLATELTQRLDLADDARDRLTTTLASDRVPLATLGASRVRKSGRTSQVAVLVDASARLVVVATRKVIGEKRWRRWAVLIGAHGRIDDCLHEDDAGDDGAALIASLCADGYRVASTDIEHARNAVAAAARMSASGAASPTGAGSVPVGGKPGHALSSSYYLGRDLLDLADAHVAGRTSPASTTLGRAVELIGEGDLPRAEALLVRCDPANPDVAAAQASIHLARGEAPAAIEALARALAAEPSWPLHHWNHAAALHLVGDSTGCYHALRRFVASSALPSGLFGDPDQPGRVASAERMLADLERTARLTGRSLVRRRRRTTRAAAKSAKTTPPAAH